MAEPKTGVLLLLEPRLRRLAIERFEGGGKVDEGFVRAAVLGS